MGRHNHDMPREPSDDDDDDAISLAGSTALRAETLEWDDRDHGEEITTPDSQGPIVRVEDEPQTPRERMRAITPGLVASDKRRSAALTPTSCVSDGGSTGQPEPPKLYTYPGPAVYHAAAGQTNGYLVDTRQYPARPKLAARLATEVRAGMHKALRLSGSKRADLLQELFNNVIHEVEDEVMSRLGYPAGSSERISYYILLCEFFSAEPEEAEDLQNVCVTLWNNINFAGVYALVFHRWLFLENYGTLNRFHVFVKGVNRLFWHDLNGSQTRFGAVYDFVKYNVLLDQSMWMKVPHNIMKDILGVVSKFFFYYDVADDPMEFLDQVGGVVDPRMFQWAQGSGQVSSVEKRDYVVNVFVTNVASQLHVMKNEGVLLDYMDRLKLLQGLDMEATVHHKLLSALHRFTIPGGPLYPPRSLRNAAAATMDRLFPEGRIIRRTVNIWFRMLHPYYWISSLTHWLCSGMSHGVRNATRAPASFVASQYESIVGSLWRRNKRGMPD